MFSPLKVKENIKKFHSKRKDNKKFPKPVLKK